MRKLSTLVLMVMVALSVNAQKKVAYCTKDKTLDATAVPFNQDPLIKVLSDAGYAVDLLASDGSSLNKDGAAVADLNAYDVIVVQESFGGGDAIFQPGNILALANLPKPTLYNKTYAFKAGRALQSGAAGGGTEDEASQILTITVPTASQSHAIFKDINFGAGDVKIFNKLSNDAGVTDSPDRTKALNYTTGTVISAANTILAYPTGKDAVAVIFINDIPGGTTVGGETIQKRMVTTGWNFGAICGDMGNNLTADTKKIWKNMVDYLAASGTSAEQSNFSNLVFTRNANFLNINMGKPQSAEISVYNIAGKMVSKMLVNGNTATIDLNNQPKGVYIVNVNGSEVRGTQKFMVR